MKVCPRCQAENDDRLHFCKECTEFLDWGKNGDNGSGAEAANGGVQTLSLTATAPATRPDTDQVTLRVFRLDRPDDDGPIEVSVPAGQSATIGARVSNQSDIVDAYTVTVEGPPGESAWWTVDPHIAYLMPSPSDGDSEDVALTVHPPRTPAAHAGPRTFQIVVTSQSNPGRSASATVVVKVEPYWQIQAAAQPAIVTSRRSGVLYGNVTNAGNERVPVLLAGSDTEDRCRVAAPPDPVPVAPGTTKPIEVRVRAKRPRPIGRPRDHRLDLVASSADDPRLTAPFTATYRQRAWVPWWAPLVVLLLALAALLAYLLWPHHVEVPNLVKLPSAFAAQKQLEAKGLTLNPQVRHEPRRDAKPGSVVDQAPAAGKHVAKGKAVSVVVASRPGKVKVPKVIGLPVTGADERLQKAGLTLGAVVPKIDPDRQVGDQVPKAGMVRPRGTPVNVTLVPKTKEIAGKGKKGAASAGAKPVPAVAGGGAAAAAAALQKAGLTPVVKVQIDPAKRGTVTATSPAQGKPPPADGIVTLTVSAGFPRIAYDDGAAVLAVGGAEGRPTVGIASGASTTTGGAWSPDGRRVAFVSSGRLFVAKPGAGGRPGRVGIGSGRAATQAAFAPFRRRAILAFADHGGSGGDAMCWLDVTAGGRPSCKRLPGWQLDGIAWSPDGRELLAPASGGGRFGLLRLATRVPFSTDRHEWTGGDALVTPNRPGHGVLAAAFSPDGKRLALVSNLDGDDFRVALAKPDDLTLAKAKPLPVEGCDVAWRSDGGELAVVQSGARCADRVGPIVRLRPADPRSLQTVVLLGEHPSWQPVDLSPGPRP
jgi:beta-lactam-binding protein with PASTA domain